MARVLVVGAGIVGLATADRLSELGHAVTVLEKEDAVARHQTGRNSGVIHSGIYYKPGSMKAELAKAGAKSMARFAEENGVKYEITGKLIIATENDQRAQLAAINSRAAENGVPAELISAEQAREYEPYVRCVEAVHVKTTGIIDYTGVCEALANRIIERGGEIAFGEAVVSAEDTGSALSVETSSRTREVDFLINCAGLQSDLVAKACGVEPEVRIIPFRGEYFELTEDHEYLVNGLIYPVPDPRFPFLGVHLTKMISGGVHAGPNAVFAFAREGYKFWNINIADSFKAATWPGLWVLGAKHLPAAAKEVARSFSRTLFAKDVAKLVPGITAKDLVPSAAGVRAQAINRKGGLVDDFFLQHAPRQIHVLNAPSPAATAALEIGAKIAADVQEQLA